MKNEIQASISLAFDPNETIHHNIQNDHSVQAEESGGRWGSKRYFFDSGRGRFLPERAFAPRTGVCGM